MEITRTLTVSYHSFVADTLFVAIRGESGFYVDLITTESTVAARLREIIRNTESVKLASGNTYRVLTVIDRDSFFDQISALTAEHRAYPANFFPPVRIEAEVMAILSFLQEMGAMPAFTPKEIKAAAV